MEFRVSMILEYKNEWKVLHVHQSSPDPNQAPGEFFPNGMIGSMNQQLKELVEKQTHALREMNEKLQYAVEHDYLTGLYNRAHFEAVVTSILRSCPRNQGVFLMLDVDDFKNINDTCGHLVGDQTLIDLVANVRSNIRKSDILGRIGGDEFVVFLKDTANDEQISSISRKISQAILNTQDMPITISVGAARYPGDGIDFQQLYGHADSAMYHEKRRNRR